jgi:hypothetical protein
MKYVNFRGKRACESKRSLKGHLQTNASVRTLKAKGSRSSMKLNAPTYAANCARDPVNATDRDCDTSGHDWAPAERVVLDLELPHIAIARALKAADDPAIWREYERSRDQDLFLTDLGRLAGTYRTCQTHFRDASRTTQWLHELVAVPFLLPAVSWPIAAPAALDRAGSGSLLPDLQQWAGCEQPVRLVAGCVKYVDVCSWSPVTQQEYLQLLAGEQRAISPSPQPFSADVPKGVVQLAFALGSVRCWNAPPQISSLSSHRDLRARMAACLSYMNQCQIGPEHVLLPNSFCASAAGGLRLWVNELLAQQLVRTWDVRVGIRDCLYLELVGTDEEFGTMLLPLRLHQLGTEGLPMLLGEMARLLGAPGQNCTLASRRLMH